MKYLLLLIFFFLEISFTSGDHYQLKKTWVKRSITSRQWRQVSGPAVANIEHPDHDTTLITDLNLPGDYQFEYSVTDNGGLTAADTMMVTVHPAVVLPLHLISFTGKPLDNCNLLEWQTMNEQNTDYFILENSSDGTNFSRLGKISAAGNSAAQKNYSFRDPAYFFTTYYRLKQVDKDENFTYSKTIKVINNHFTQKLTVISPVHSQIEMIIFSATRQSALIYLYDIAGRQILQAGVGCNIGANRFIYDATLYRSGIYILQAKLKDGTSLHQKVVIIK